VLAFKPKLDWDIERVNGWFDNFDGGRFSQLSMFQSDGKEIQNTSIIAFQARF